jgi:hypothetical protein
MDIAIVIVFLGSLFCREFAGFTGLVSKAIRGRDGFTRDFGCGRYENLSGAISWLTFFAGGAADVRRSLSDWRRELAESTIVVFVRYQPEMPADSRNTMITRITCD